MDIAILRPLEVAVAWIMVQFHSLLTAVGMDSASGWTWGLSIVGLVVVIRILLIPLFVKQINASRGMQLIQPELQKIQKKYKGKTDPVSRQAMAAEMQDLYKRTGTNPFASCLPILLQAPIFFALFNVLNNLSRIADGRRDPVGPLTQDLAAEAEVSTLLGAQLSDTFLRTDDPAVRILTVVLIVLMSLTTFTTQRQLMRKNMPAAALDNPFAQQQKILLYVLPVIFAVSGVNFPIGVLLYWLTTNIWSMGQQFYVIRRNPAPGSPAEKALQERRARRAQRKGKGTPAVGTGAGSDDAQGGSAAESTGTGAGPVAGGASAAVSGQRQQPRRQPRQKRKGGSSRPAGASAADRRGRRPA